MVTTPGALPQPFPHISSLNPLAGLRVCFSDRGCQAGFVRAGVGDLAIGKGLSGQWREGLASDLPPNSLPEATLSFSLAPSHLSFL